MECQVCQSKDTKKVLSLGHQPPSDAFLTDEKLEEPEETFPLDVYFCKNCKLVQLSYAVEPKELFGEDYIYMSGVNTMLKKNLQSIADYLAKNFNLKENDLAIDIGSNDGTLLEGYQQYKLKILGIDPSSVADIAIEKGIPTIKNFFNEELAKKILKDHGKAKVITATNVFAHVKELHSFVNGIKLLLDDKGVFVTESHYLLDMISKLQYVEIYLEHLRYYSVESLINLFNHFDMDVFHVEHIDTHGGSIRVFACKKGAYPTSDSVKEFLEKEKKYSLNSLDTLEEFKNRVNKQREKLMTLLWNIKSKGHKIVGISAPAKGSTLLNFCKIGPEILDYTVEKSDLKIGKYSPYTHIKILDETILFKEQPEYALLLSWDIKDVLIPKLRQNGYNGKIIIPIPEPEIV